MYRIGASLEGTILSDPPEEKRRNCSLWSSAKRETIITTFEAFPRVVTEDSTRGRGAYPT